SRVRGRIEAILDWARTRGYRDGENPARWRGHLQNLLPARNKLRPKVSQPAMPDAEMPAFMAELRARDGMAARALALTIHCAARSGEVIGAKWSEFDYCAKTWTVPKERMKAGKEHKVPLSNRAIEILENTPRVHGCDFIFPGAKIGRHLTHTVMLQLLQRMR